MSAPTRLRVEHLVAPLGITTPAPRLSWWLPEGAGRQRAYRIRGHAGGREWDTGWVESDRSLFVPCGGPPLGSREEVRWSVRVRTEAGLSPWPEPSGWETGLLAPDDWVADWIGPAEDEVAPPGFRPGFHLRGEFALVKAVSRARVYATAHGLNLGAFVFVAANLAVDVLYRVLDPRLAAERGSVRRSVLFAGGE